MIIIYLLMVFLLLLTFLSPQEINFGILLVEPFFKEFLDFQPKPPISVGYLFYVSYGSSKNR